jgi:hypothetical protein
MSSSNDDKRPGHCMVSACICCYRACDFEDFVFLCAGGGDCLCIRYTSCLAIGYESLGCGMVTDEERGEICKIGCLCMQLGLITPQKCCGCASQFLCCQDVASFPFDDDYVKECVCASMFIACAPECGCCAAPPVANAFKIMRTTQSVLKASQATAAPAAAAPAAAAPAAAAPAAEPPMDREV